MTGVSILPVHARTRSEKRRVGFRFGWRFLLLLLLPVGIQLLARAAERSPSNRTASAPITYARDVAPLLFNHCVECHRPGQAAPFELLSYAGAKRRARDIARATAAKIMPPWLPVQGFGEFKGERHLTSEQIDLFQRWAEQGAPEGDPSDTPPPPRFSFEWQLGKPDLVIEPSEALMLPATGKDPYYNFVLPVRLPEGRYVAGVELLAGTPALHHAFLFMDETGASQRKGANSVPLGFEGMDPPESAAMPAGQLLGWNPGKMTRLIDNGLFWKLPAKADLVLQTHLNVLGREERVRPRLGFYFTNQPPAAQPYRMWLATFNLDIPPGVSNYVAETAYTLPVDLAFLRVGTHAHYLCRQMEGFAVLPGGEKKWLLRVDNWNFAWQGDYEYKEPVQIPRGSRIVMRFTYDNSTNNVSNPFNPPKRVVWGPTTTDEMGELMFQCLPRNAADHNTLFEDFRQFNARSNAEYYRTRLTANAADTQALLKLGRALVVLGQTNAALSSFRELVRLEPANDLPHFELGSIYLHQGRLARARGEFREVIRLNPNDGYAYENIGIIYNALGQLDEARLAFEIALRINPDNAHAQRSLERLQAGGTENRR